MTVPTKPVVGAGRADGKRGDARNRRFAATGPSSVVTTPDEAIHDDESRRIRSFAFFVLGLTTAVALAVEYVGGDLLARRVHQGGLVAAALGSSWIIYRVRDRTDFGWLENIVFALICIVAAATGFLYWGPLSAMLLVVPFGAFVFSSVRSAYGAAVVTALLCAAHLGLALLIIFGELGDRSLIRPHQMSIGAQVLTVFLIEAVFVAAFVMARSARRSARAAIEDLDRAVRALRVRDALLEEAKNELDRVLQIGGPGRYTEQRIGSFKLGVVLGRGGMGEVYEAQHVETGEEAAVKLLHPHVLADPDHIRRFLRELRIVASLDEPHVVRVLEVPASDAGLPFMAMERLRGKSLAEILKERGRLPLADVVDLVRQVGKGLETAHAAGVIHRDLKPHNLFLARQARSAPIWKVLDFGVCKLSDTEGTLTKGRVVGTPAYMAPEQADNRDVDYRADIYSLGVIAYRCLTGRPAFSGHGLAAILNEVINRMPPAPTSLRELPAAVDVVMAVALAKDRKDRFDSSDQLASALESAGEARLPDWIERHARELLIRYPWQTPRTS